MLDAIAVVKPILFWDRTCQTIESINTTPPKILVNIFYALISIRIIQHSPLRNFESATVLEW